MLQFQQQQLLAFSNNYLFAEIALPIKMRGLREAN